VSSASHVVVGGGVHGLSVAAALARGLGGSGSPPRVLLIERARLGAGASGIAGGIVRGYYRSPAIAEIVRLSVERFEQAPAAYGFRQVGFLAAANGPDAILARYLCVASVSYVAGLDDASAPDPDALGRFSRELAQLCDSDAIQHDL